MVGCGRVECALDGVDVNATFMTTHDGTCYEWAIVWPAGHQISATWHGEDEPTFARVMLALVLAAKTWNDAYDAMQLERDTFVALYQALGEAEFMRAMADPDGYCANLQ